MPFLTVLGKGSWTGDSIKLPDGRYKMVTFGPGVHEVDERMAEKAREAIRKRGLAMLMVTDYKPEVVTDPEREKEGGGLTPEDIKKPRARGVQLRKPDGSALVPEEAESVRRVLATEFPCEHCELAYASQAALEWHVEMVHDVDVPTAPDVEPEPEPEVPLWEHPDAETGELP